MTRCLLIALLLPATALAADKDQLIADDAALKQANQKTDGPALIAFFKARTPGDKALTDIEGLIRDLGHNSFRVRQKATDELHSIGPKAIGPLKGALASSDLEVRYRARRLLESIEKSVQPELIASAARLIADRKPAGAVQVLLDHLPFVGEPDVADEIILALAAVGCQGGKVDDTLRAALQEKNVIRRAAAAEAVARAGGAEELAKVRALLKDPDARVRVRVALALVERKEREAVEPLINLLTEAGDHFWRIEQTLYVLAGDDAPKVARGTSDLELRDFRKAWLEWWRDKGPSVNLAVLDDSSRLRGLTLIVQYDQRVAVGGPAVRAGMGRVYEVGRDGKVRWEIANLAYPLDAQVVGPDRVLIAEYRGRQVSERNFKGEVIWSRPTNGMSIGVQRLPSGNTLIVQRNEVVEVNRAGQEIFRAASDSGYIIGARRTKNGETLLLDRTGVIQRLDAKGKEIKRFTSGQPLSTLIGTHFDVLPNGNLLIPVYQQNKVVEVDGDGKVVRTIQSQQPTGVSVLPNGNALIASRYARSITEVDRTGKVLWQYQSPSGAILVGRRR